MTVAALNVMLVFRNNVKYLEREILLKQKKFSGCYVILFHLSFWQQ